MLENVSVVEPAKTALTTAAADRRLPHALILEGTSAENRLAAAYEVARAAVCLASGAPCGQCSSCKKAEKHIHPDIRLVEKPEKKALYPVDNIRRIKTESYIVPGEGACKVFIFTQAECLSAGSQNALLKLIEEPPERTVFILLCPSVSYLLETVRSRAASFYLGEPVSDIQTDEGMKLACKLLVLLSEGKEAEFMASTAPLEKDKPFYLSTLTGLQECLRDVLAVKCAGKRILPFSAESDKAVMRLSANAAMSLLEKVKRLLEDAQYNLNQNLAVTRLCSVLFTRN